MTVQFVCDVNAGSPVVTSASLDSASSAWQFVIHTALSCRSAAAGSAASSSSATSSSSSSSSSSSPPLLPSSSSSPVHELRRRRILVLPFSLISSECRCRYRCVVELAACGDSQQQLVALLCLLLLLRLLVFHLLNVCQRKQPESGHLRGRKLVSSPCLLAAAPDVHAGSRSAACLRTLLSCSKL